MNTLRYLCIAVAASVFAGVTSAQPKDLPPDDAKPIVVPIEILPSKHFVLKVMLEGKGPYRLILDTGAPLTIIDTKTANDAGLSKKKAGGGGILGMLGGGLNQVTVNKVKIGDLETEKMPAVVMDHPTVKAISDAFAKDSGPIHGIIGFPFFARYAMTVDYQKKELTFKPNGYKPVDYLEGMMATLMNTEARNAPRILAAAGLWGVIVHKDAKETDAGVTITKLYETSPAAKAGLKVGDRVLTIDGRWTDSVADTFLATSSVKAGTEVPVVIQRDGKKLTVKVTPVAGH